MVVEIWSDMVCPYCYIGKRKFEDALRQFPHASEVKVVWRSFQLDPDVDEKSKQNTYEYIAKVYDISYEQSVAQHKELIERAREVGLTYNFDSAVVANTFNAHRLAHLAKKYGRGDQAEELLFKAYFTEGKNINDLRVLHEMGLSIGLKDNELNDFENNIDTFKEEVEADFLEAENFGVDVVPFFLFDKKFAISGAQSVENYLKVLEKSYTEWQKSSSGSVIEVMEGKSCNLNGECS